MAGFVNARNLSDAFEGGRTLGPCSFRKVPGAAQATTANWWADLSMFPGNPPPNYYATAPLEAAKLDPLRGIYHGTDKSPASLHLASELLITPSAGFVGEYILCDYLLYYPFVDLDDLDEQPMVNTEVLDRYTDGDGVRIMMVCQNPTVGSGTFSFTYYNQAGVLKTAPTQSCSTAVANTGSLVNAEPARTGRGNVFLLLADGDYGVRSIVSWTNIVSNGGLAALVLVKPLTSPIRVLEASVPVEREFFKDRAAVPVIEDGAYLNFIIKTGASIASGTLTGVLSYVWSE